MEFNLDTYETYVPPVNDTLKQMTKLPLVWLDIFVILADLVFIGWIISTGGNLTPVIIMIVAIILMVIALNMQYGVAQSKIRLSLLEKLITEKEKEVADHMHKEGSGNG
jgi:hypothetical protein